MRHPIVSPPRAGLFTVLLLAAIGCAPKSGGPSFTGPASTSAAGASAEPSRGSLSPIVGYVNGQALRRDAMWPPLIEVAGALVFEELVLDELLRQRLAERGMTLTDADIAAERDALSAALSDDPEEAARLTAALRDRRGLGDDRFDRLLRRNAALRKLTAADVVVTDLQVQRAYTRVYGPRYRVRLITADTAPAAQRLRQRALAGEPFGELAARHSTDASAAQGGLLSPVSPEDPTYPQAVRTALPRLDPAVDAGVSPVLALDGGFALLKLEEVLEAQDVAFVDVEAELTEAMRRQNARLLMEQQARALVTDADVLVLDPAIKRQRER